MIQGARIVFALAVAAVATMAFGCASTRLPGRMAPASFDQAEAIETVGQADSSSYPGRLSANLRRELETAWNALSSLPFDACPEEALAAGERFLAVAAAVEPLATCPGETFWLRTRTRHARRTILAQNFALRFECWQRLYLEAETYTQAITMAERMLELIRETAASDLASHNERFTLERLADQWRENLACEREQLSHQRHELDVAFGRRQGTFATCMGQRDVDAARQLLESQNRKRFNWKILGHPRDNQSLILVAIQRAQRAANAAQAATGVRAQAGEIVEQADARLDREARRRLRLRLPLPDYSTFADYPQASEQARARLADIRIRDDELETMSVAEGVGDWR